MTDVRPPLHPLYRVTVAAGSLFILTILLLIASALAPSTPSPARALFDEYAGMILALEVLVIMVASFGAMAGDRETPPADSSRRDDDQGRPQAD